MALSVDDLETEFERALRRLRESGRVSAAPGPGEPPCDDDNAPADRELLAELRGIQTEIEQYARARAERRRMAQSTPVVENRGSRRDPHDRRQRHKRQGTAGSREEELLQQRQGKHEEEETAARGGGGAARHAWRPATGLAASAVGIARAPDLGERARLDETINSMEDYFESENEELERIVDEHFRDVGLRRIRKTGDELAERRERSLLDLRRELESRNQRFVDGLRATYEEQLEADKAALRVEMEAKRVQLEREAAAQFSEAARREALRAYGEQLDAAIAKSVAAAREALRREHRDLLEELSARKLQEREEEIRRTRLALSEELSSKEQRELRDLDLALQEGARQAREVLVAEHQRSTESAAAALREKWAHRRQTELAPLRAELEARERRELEALELHEEEQLERSKVQLRADAERQLREAIAQHAQQARARRAEIEASEAAAHEKRLQDELARLDATARADLEQETEALRRAAQQRLELALEEEQAALAEKQTRALSELEAGFEEQVREARQAYRAFRRKSVLQGACDDAKSGSSDSGEEGDLPSRQSSWTVPKRIAASETGERVVRNLLEGLCESHQVLAQRLRECQRKLARTAKDMIQARHSRALDGSAGEQALAKAHADLRESRLMVQKLFAANGELKAQVQAQLGRSTSSRSSSSRLSS